MLAWLSRHCRGGRAPAEARIDLGALRRRRAVPCLARLAKDFPRYQAEIRNPLVVPASMKEEGGGPKSPFWPSSAKTNVGGIIPSDFFMDSKLCGECHKDIYEQWNSSMHHFASFNNQFYRKSIEHMQERQRHAGQQVVRRLPRSRGVLQRPLRAPHQRADRHSGGAERARLRLVPFHRPRGRHHGKRRLHDRVPAAARPGVAAAIRGSASWTRFLTYIEPGAAPQTFMKPFMRQDCSEFCSDVPQGASGRAGEQLPLAARLQRIRQLAGERRLGPGRAVVLLSGEIARPARTATCRWCRRRTRAIATARSTRTVSPAANTAVAHVNQDDEAVGLDRGVPEVGLHHAWISSPRRRRRSTPGTQMRRRVGEMRRSSSPRSRSARKRSRAGRCSPRGRQAGGAHRRGGREIPAGLDGAGGRGGADAEDRPFLPGGTVDAFDVWLELQGKDADGRSSSGAGGWRRRQGPVERARISTARIMLDGEGNPINKRNAWQARSVLYVRLIPPGAADVAHFRVQIPEGRAGSDHAHGEAQLPEVLPVLHAVRLRRASGPAGRELGRAAITTAAGTRSSKR